MTEAPKDAPFSELIANLDGLFASSQAAMAIYLSQLVENILESSLTSKLTIPSNNFDDRLFKGYGPLSTFTAKIDMARALEILDEETYNTLRVLKSIRNEFAHPDLAALPTFDSPAVVKECRKLPSYVDDENCFHLFIGTVASIMDNIDDSGIYSEMFRGIAPAPKSSAKKSP